LPTGHALRDFRSFDDDTRLVELLRLKAPAFTRAAPFSQLIYIEEYVRSLGCRCVLLEERYVDRDYIEDHSLFYSRSFFGYRNYCRRLHFFSSPPKRIQSRISELAALSGTADAEQQWRAFSEESYLGFTVIKPLPGSPVGRTVLRCVGTNPRGSSDLRHFPGVRQQFAHVGPVRLSVRGLPFQQQDVGVSACATTALWSALHKLRDFEEIGAPTPAQITTLATQYYLPFGRPMPSDEGLSLENMCMALQALKVAPNLLRTSTYADGRAYIHAALRSGFAPVLILQSALEKSTWHAVTAVGYRSAPTPPLKPNTAYGLAGDMLSLYVHDDRVGPYQRVDLFASRGALGIRSHYSRDDHQWLVRYVLIPLHSKIRIPITGLLDITIDALGYLQQAFRRGSGNGLAVAFDCWIARPATYLRSIVSDTAAGGIALADTLSAAVPMPRYVGIVRVRVASSGTADILIDTTSTMKNLHMLAVTYAGTPDVAIFRGMSERYQCPLVLAGPAPGPLSAA
jgi:hypothetical protein